MSVALQTGADPDPEWLLVQSPKQDLEEKRKKEKKNSAHARLDTPKSFILEVAA